MTDETMTPDPVSEAEWAEAEAAMMKAGREAGTAAATWLLDGNSTAAAARRLLDEIENCELDSPAPFDGINADQMTISEAVATYTDVDPDSMTNEEADELAAAYEDGFAEGYQFEAERSARAFLTDDAS